MIILNKCKYYWSLAQMVAKIKKKRIMIGATHKVRHANFYFVTLAYTPPKTTFDLRKTPSPDLLCIFLFYIRCCIEYIQYISVWLIIYQRSLFLYIYYVQWCMKWSILFTYWCIHDSKPWPTKRLKPSPPPRLYVPQHWHSNQCYRFDINC